MNADSAIVARNRDSGLPECGGIQVLMDKGSGAYETCDTLVLAIKNLTSDSMLVSAGLEGNASKWEPVIHDVFGFAHGGSRMSDEVTTRILRPMDSVETRVTLWRLG